MKLIGMDTMTAFIDKVCSSAPLYRSCGIAPPHMSIPLNPGGGRSHLLRYILERYESAGVCKFTGVDKLQEYTLDGTLSQLYSVKRDAYYSIVGREIKAFDASALAEHLFEHQVDVFLDMAQDLSTKHLLVFYWPADPDRNTQALMDRVSAVVPGLATLGPITYREDQLLQIGIALLEKYNVKFEGDPACLSDALKKIFSHSSVTSPRDAATEVNALLLFSEMQYGRPVLRQETLLTLASQTTRKEGKQYGRQSVPNTRRNT